MRRRCTPGQAELDALRNENADLGRQRDVSLTAMYSALASADEARRQVADLLASEEERRLQLRVRSRQGHRRVVP